MLVIFVPIAIIITIAKAKEGKVRKEWVAFAYPRWQRARRLWDKLYCCSRNDIVFLPGRQGAYAPASEMDEFLVAQASQ